PKRGQELHAQANAEERFAFFSDFLLQHLNPALAAKFVHRIAKRSNPGQNDMRSVAQFFGPVGEVDASAEGRPAVDNRTKVAQSSIDDACHSLYVSVIYRFVCEWSRNITLYLVSAATQSSSLSMSCTDHSGTTMGAVFAAKSRRLRKNVSTR